MKGDLNSDIVEAPDNLVPLQKDERNELSAFTIKNWYLQSLQNNLGKVHHMSQLFDISEKNCSLQSLQNKPQ